MSSLADVITETAPDPDDLGELTSYGDTLLRSADAAGLLTDPIKPSLAEQSLPEFVALAEAAIRAGHPAADTLASIAAHALTVAPPTLVFLDASDITLASPGILSRHARVIASELSTQFADLLADGAGLAAYNILETLVRLALAEKSLRFTAMSALVSIDASSPLELTERVPHLAGIAHDMWGEPELTRVLELALDHEGSRADATFELALASLRDGLAADTRAGVIERLTDARAMLRHVEALEEAREDATLYRCALDVVLAFASSAAVDESISAELAATTTTRRAHSAGGRAWIAPRRYAEAEWYTLAASLTDAAHPLTRASWRTPGATLTAVLHAYRASRSVTVMKPDGLRMVIEPAVEGAFIRREGLATHVRDLLEADEISPEDRPDAQALLEAIDAADNGGAPGGDAVGKALAAAPELARELAVADAPQLAEPLAQLAHTCPTLLRRLESDAVLRARERAIAVDPLVDRVVANVREQLKPCRDFIGDAALEFTELMTIVFRFLADRADIGKITAGDLARYLFEPGPGQEPFTEVHLQRDAGWFLKGSPLRPAVRFEENDVAAGRADLTVVPGVHRFSVEIKRELGDASRQGIYDRYSTQATAYTATGPSMAMLLVLDLTDHSHGVPGVLDSIWVDTVAVPDGNPRHLVVGVVRGNRPSPSSLTAPPPSLPTGLDN